MNISIKSKNLEALEKHHPDVFRLTSNFTPQSSSLELMTEKSRSGALTLSALSTDKKRIYLHSKYDPVKESEKISDSWLVNKTDSNVLVLGFGLGYLPMAMNTRIDSNQILYIIEPSIEIFLRGIEETDLTPILTRSNTIFLIGNDFLTNIKIYFKESNINTVFFTHQPSLQLFPELNNAILLLENVSHYRLRKELDYSKFNSEPFKVLLFESGFFIEREIKNTLEHLGTPYRTLSVDQNQREGQSGFIKNLLEVLSDFKPDFILTINQWGFDQEGKLAEMLTHYKMPFVSWFVDNPLPLLSRKSTNASEFGISLLWDRHYTGEMTSLGFPNVYYFPYATDKNVFCPSADPVPQKYPVSFVGSSLNKIIAARLKEIGDDVLLKGIYDKLTQNPPFSILKIHKTIDIIKNELGDINYPDEKLASLEVAINSKLTQDKRVRSLLAIEDFGPHLFGDEAWKELLPSSFHLHPEVSYHKELPGIYRATGINLNILNVQLKDSVNQRLFDVCACGSFLLTEHGPGIQEFLFPGKSVETFDSPEQMREKVDYFLKHPEEMEEIAKKGSRDILERHTYVHRIRDIFLLLSKSFAS